VAQRRLVERRAQQLAQFRCAVGEEHDLQVRALLENGHRIRQQAVAELQPIHPGDSPLPNRVERLAALV
jgi:hypothetical protein